MVTSQNKMDSQLRSVKIQFLIKIIRFIVGVLFIFSGLIKANDPLGLSYKMQEFFEVWHIHFLDNYTLPFSISMIVFEIAAGVAVLLAWQMKLFSWLLLALILFFTFLTGYAFLSGKIKDCGCFGNCIPLTAGQSFAKDIILLVLILILFINRRFLKAWIPNPYNLIIIFFAVVFSFSLQWYVLQFLPVVDCLPYNLGSSIPEKMKAPTGSLPDSSVISFQYAKNGKTIEFTADHFPSDFDESYHFIRRYDKLIRKGNAEPPIKDFVLQTASGNDTTLSLMSQGGNALFLFAKDLPQSNPAWNKEFAAIFSFVKMKNMTVYIVTASPDDIARYLASNNITEHVQVLTCDVTAIKTASRANPTLMLIKKGAIMGKWGYGDFENAIPIISALPEQ